MVATVTYKIRTRTLWLSKVSEKLSWMRTSLARVIFEISRGLCRADFAEMRIRKIDSLRIMLVVLFPIVSYGRSNLLWYAFFFPFKVRTLTACSLKLFFVRLHRITFIVSIQITEVATAWYTLPVVLRSSLLSWCVHEWHDFYPAIS